ncbi:hypothetical protein [Nocardia sp. NRRL S-836]|uniref:hypothetical protein n=1 Tax=Nocardia sp. NRRL S-836 TaxID=1519492 RepID=UPI0006AD980C|nr:hypothetical protein [Nocardia sp. NRRL S-836]KOV84706.1 hypothetical protein ADL03_15655 [Nocardia sp. NRRL S-836]
MATSDLPRLVGSPEQIAWAEGIRAKALVEIDKSRAEMAAHVAEHPEAAAEEAANNAAFDQAIKAHPDARWWIDCEDLAEYHLRVEVHEIIARAEIARST